MTTRPTDADIIAAAVAWLATGLLPSALPARLMEQFSIGREKAARLAAEAIKRRREQQEGPG